MSKTKALKYLILDTINKYKNTNNSELINKIQNSLNVEDQDINYKITWRTNDANVSIISKGDFKFYERNDIINNENNLSAFLYFHILRQMEVKTRKKRAILLL